MSDFLFDFEDPGDVGLLPEARYEVYLQDISPGEWDSGAKYIKFHLITCNHEDDEYNKRHLWLYAATSSKKGEPLSFGRDAYAAFVSLDEVRFTDKDGVERYGVPDDIRGRLAMANVVHEEYNGLLQERIKSLTSHASNPYEHYDPDDDEY